MARPLADLPDNLRSAVEGEMDQGERVIWVEQPLPSAFARAALPLLLFAIPFGGFAVFWMVSAFRTSHNGAFALSGLPFFLIGLGMFSTPLWYARRAGRTAYVVTDRRAIVFAGGSSTTVRAFSPGELSGYTKRERSGGSGDLVFGDEYVVSSRGQTNTRNWQNGFFGVPNVQEAEKFVKALIAHGDVQA